MYGERQQHQEREAEEKLSRVAKKTHPVFTVPYLESSMESHAGGTGAHLYSLIKEEVSLAISLPLVCFGLLLLLRYHEKDSNALL